MGINEVKVLTLYIAAWGWQLLSFICLTSGVLLIVVSNTLASIVFGTSFILCFAGCQFMSLKRKREVEDEEN